jgi:hypothetical protein
MTLWQRYARRAFALAALVFVTASVPVRAQAPPSGSIVVVATFDSRLKMTFDRTAVVFDTEAYDINTVVPVNATTLTVSAKARVPPNTRIVMTVQADGPFNSGVTTIPANKLTWTMTGPGFQNGGTANEHVARMLGSWRGSGSWTGEQTYQFLDSWDYAVGMYSLTMMYTISAP